MNNKTRIEELNKIANLYEDIRKSYHNIGWKTAAVEIDKVVAGLDETISKFQEEVDFEKWAAGDVAEDRFGYFWKFDGGYWKSFHDDPGSTTSFLQEYAGPLKRVTIADPSNSEVVVSVEGIKKPSLDKWSDIDVPPYGRGSSSDMLYRVAEAELDQISLRTSN